MFRQTRNMAVDEPSLLLSPRCDVIPACFKRESRNLAGCETGCPIEAFGHDG
jgi:hypothetical protein